MAPPDPAEGAYRQLAVRRKGRRGEGVGERGDDCDFDPLPQLSGYATAVERWSNDRPMTPVGSGRVWSTFRRVGSKKSGRWTTLDWSATFGGFYILAKASRKTRSTVGPWSRDSIRRLSGDFSVTSITFSPFLLTSRENVPPFCFLVETSRISCSTVEWISRDRSMSIARREKLVRLSGNERAWPTTIARQYSKVFEDFPVLAET